MEVLTKNEVLDMWPRPASVHVMRRRTYRGEIYGETVVPWQLLSFSGQADC